LSFLTKVFVVLVTFMAVMLVALIVPFVANTQNFKELRDEARDLMIQARASAELRQSELNAMQLKSSEQIISLKSEADNLMTQVNLLTQRLAESEAQLYAQRAHEAKFEADWGRLTAANQQHAQIVQALQTELSKRREQMVDQQTKMIQQADRNNELESQVEALSRQLERMQEDFARLEQEHDQAQSQLAQLPLDLRPKSQAQQTQPYPFVPQLPIKGFVTSVDQIENEMFVQVNVGSNDGVAENMKFLVHRGHQFLATLIITAVDLQSSAGRLQLQQGLVSVGDTILTGGGY